MKTLNQHTEKEYYELIYYLKETIDNICDRVRNKMVGPYCVLERLNGNNPPKELVDVSLKGIRWLCHDYLPSIIASVERKIHQLSR